MRIRDFYFGKNPIFTFEELLLSLLRNSRTDPEVALERLKSRGRGEEHLISLDYIKKLHRLKDYRLLLVWVLWS